MRAATYSSLASTSWLGSFEYVLCDQNGRNPVLIHCLELYTDESPGLKVDPFVVMVLSIGFIISVVALHSMML